MNHIGNEPIDPILNNLLTRLQFISGVGIDQKINFKNQYYVDRTSWFGSIYRYLESERQSGNGTVYIDATINETIAVMKTLRNATHKEYLFQHICLTIKGLKRLRETYSKISYQNKIMQEMDAFILRFEVLVPTHILQLYGLRASSDQGIIKPKPIENNEEDEEDEEEDDTEC
jgi:hypothetical protein